MKLKSLNITDFRGLSDVNITDLDPHLNLLIGVNGAGKSSILDAIALLLIAFTSRLSISGNKGNAASLFLSSDVKRFSRSGCTLRITLDNDVTWSMFKTLKLEKKEKSDYSELNNYTKNLRIQLDERIQKSVPIIVHYGVKRSNTDNLLPTAAYKDWINSKASYRDIFPWLRSEEDYENELIRDNPTARDRGLEALRRAMLSIFPEYTDLRVRRKPRQEVVLKKNNEEFPLSLLSDGEKCYIALVCDIVRRLTIANPQSEILDGDGIVMIDEVDLHLHPKWEQSIMTNLRKTFCNIQFIVSAHSPLVASNFDGKVYAVNNGTVTSLPRIFGLDYSTILQDWMNTSSENKDISVLVELYNAYKKHNMTEQAQAVKERLINALHGDINAPILKTLQKDSNEIY
jgi:predicted ATP-binding protein involved in virulence